MSIIGLFDIGKSALFASQAGLSVTSNNIANVNTPGYSRQELVLEIATPATTRSGFMGRGVTTAGIRRSYDRFIQSQLIGQQQSQGRSAAMDGTWGQVEQVFNEAQGFGLSAPLTDYFNAWQEVANDPEGQTPRTMLLQKAGALVSAAQGMERSVRNTLKSANDGIADAVTQVNGLAKDIASLNDRITQVESGANSEKANELRDQRDNLMSELSKLIEFSSYEDANGSVTITAGMRNLVSGARTNTLSTTVNSAGNRELSLDNINITGAIRNGQIGGYIAARADVESSALTGLRKIIASVTQQVNALHQGGFGLDASTGNDFFNPLQLTTTDDSPLASITAATITSQTALTLDEYRIGFDGLGNYSVSNKQTGAAVAAGAYNPAGTTIALPGMSIDVSGAVTKADSFTVSPLTTAVSGFGVSITDEQRVAAASVMAELPGNNTNALALSGLTESAVANLGNTTYSGYYNSLVSTIGVMDRAAADSATFDENLTAELAAKRDSVSGVSLDEEAANLIRFQRSYEAGARMIKVADELFQTVLSL